jgi:hypothetical protein
MLCCVVLGLPVQVQVQVSIKNIDHLTLSIVKPETEQINIEISLDHIAIAITSTDILDLTCTGTSIYY